LHLYDCERRLIEPVLPAGIAVHAPPGSMRGLDGNF
jgi:hypothetical protein